MYAYINQDNLDELFEFIKQGEVFSLLTYDEILTYEIVQENEELKEELEEIRGGHSQVSKKVEGNTGADSTTGVVP